VGRYKFSGVLVRILLECIFLTIFFQAILALNGARKETQQEPLKNFEKLMLEHSYDEKTSKEGIVFWLLWRYSLLG